MESLHRLLRVKPMYLQKMYVVPRRSVALKIAARDNPYWLIYVRSFFQSGLRLPIVVMLKLLRRILSE